MRKWPALVLTALFLLLPKPLSALPGTRYQTYLEAYGHPSHLPEEPNRDEYEPRIQYYWEGVEPSLLSGRTGVKGSLVVLFERRENGLWSLRETFLGKITGPEFTLMLDRSRKDWETVSRTRGGDTRRAYDLYRLISKDQKFAAEISYSPLESISPPDGAGSVPQAPLLNLWIQVVPAP